ncbi:ADP-dependent glucokinase/phosphofructokinase [Pseudactinotalea suaedae]|uniref:ADP-dependent glucokinase/phosphofructokinase n=1 Tax=Pseudactinotalea suaedae TaxID=1524924 RepID=UPI0012E30DDC|nr:ADP-dependent glucokinase/phosphofructokinase [Pseudactinotalea suaedae]
MTGGSDARQRYEQLVEQREALVAASGPIVAGFSATTDALHRVSDAALERLMTAGHVGSDTFGQGLATLRRWLLEGRDGELFIDDEDAEPLLEQLAGAPERVQCGGTSIQACWSWSSLGLAPLLALTNRSERQLRATAEHVRVIAAGEPITVRRVTPVPGPVVPSNHVLELTRGTSGGGVTVARSSRITVVLARKRLQLDPGFLTRSAALVRDGVGLVSGLNGIGRAREAAVPQVAEAAAGWRAGGARLVHLELAEYAGAGELGRVMELVGEHVDSVGMNASELNRLVGAGDPAHVAAAFAAEHKLARVVVHADEWAMSVHRRDPEREELALAAGSLAAANRAEAGEPRGSWVIPDHSSLAVEIPPAGPVTHGYRASVVATPYLVTPRSTIGLGDTFVSGDLLVQASSADLN